MTSQFLRNAPHLCFRKASLVSVVGLQVRLGKQALSKLRKATPTQTTISRQVYVHARLVQHQYSVFF